MISMIRTFVVYCIHNLTIVVFYYYYSTCVALLLYSGSVALFFWLFVHLSIPYPEILFLSILYLNVFPLLNILS